MAPEDISLKYTPFPALSRQTTGTVNGIKTDASSVYFADRILITISQGERLAHWVEVALGSASPNQLGNTLPPDDETNLLPQTHLTPKTLLGASNEQRDTLCHLYATHIADQISRRDLNDSRIVLVGLGLERIDLQREAFFDMMELVQKII
ncbi:hypothetical protein GcM1_191004 [Golovinomyces cichoracearum]|uniref:Uncharacterized protein n=1 Tax=Golovinomyces cichoracearum TaxID=62708 RepID=A0A420J1D5_9PEZI|nr:hypothetical protein GcM1_191004 [Golovinomyces cichoracearum]